MLKLKSSEALKSGTSFIDMTPMIDIVFQLLIFFLLTSIFASQPALDLVLPQAEHAQVREDKKEIRLSIRKGGEIFLDREAVPPGGLRAALEARVGEDRKNPVLVSADQDIPFQVFVDVIDTLQGLGLSDVALLTQPGEGRP